LINNTKLNFNKSAKDYDDFNIIQKIVSKAVVNDIKNKPQNILELGCGTGDVYRQISWQTNSYKAVDFSQNMCDKHIKDNHIEVCCLDFDQDSFFDNIKGEKYDLVVSSSALQWSKDLDKLLFNIQKTTDYIVMALFTSNTFKTIFDISNTVSPIISIQEIKTTFGKYFNCDFETHSYHLMFQNQKEMFNMIKKSGVSGNKRLNYKQAKNLWQNYSLDYLEFEVIYITGRKL